jgi:hypothetical protein
MAQFTSANAGRTPRVSSGVGGPAWLRSTFGGNTEMSTPEHVPAYHYRTSYLNELIRCAQPMTTELARIIRALHKDHGLDYDTLPSYLCDGDTTGPESFGAGKVLVELAAFHLREDFRSWSQTK